jgi:type II restriction/modification system DNA methylase subunit YeeA
MVRLVERMLDLHKRIPATPQEQERLARDIASTDREIDNLVYQLYGLTEEEIKIVEGA